MDAKIRLATLADCDELLSIYTPYVTDTTISFEHEAPSPDEFMARMKGIMSAYPYIVCETGEGIAGFAYASRFKERASYDWDINLSIYFKEDLASRGLGSRMYACLTQLLKLQNVQNMYGYIDGDNARSERFHLKNGFTRFVRYEKVGYKLGRWLDSIGFVKYIGSHEDQPAPFIAFPNVDVARVDAILENA